MKQFIYLILMNIEPIFYKLVYMSAGAIIIGLAIIITKMIFKNKLSYKWITIFWGLFIVSLIFPFEIRTHVSIYNLIPIYFENIAESQPALKNYARYQSLKLNNIYTEETTAFQIKTYIFLGIIIVWLLAIAYYILVYICEQIELKAKTSKQKIKDERLTRILENCKRELNIRKDIILVNNKNLKMPVICGIFKIRILLSDEIIALSDKDIYNIFLHELSHYERKDNLYNLIITIIRGVYIFNPAIWVLLKELEKDIELATDEYALYYKSEEEKKEYIETLEKIEKFENKNSLCAIGIAEKKKILNARIENIGKMSKNIASSKKISKFASIIFIILFLVFFTKGKNYKTRDELYELCTELNNYDNVHITQEVFDFDGDKAIKDYYWREARMLSKYKNDYCEITQFYNFANNTDILIGNYGEDKSIISKGIEYYGSNDYEKTNLLGIENIGYWSNCEYIWCGSEKLRGRETYKIALVGDYSKTLYWIDKEKNLVLKEQDIYDEKIQTNYYYYEFDTVTEEDVEKPDINDYPDYKIITED